jgi:hypothetical protein
VRRLIAALLIGQVLAAAAAASPVRSLGRLSTAGGGSIEIAVDDARDVVYIQTHDGAVRTSTLTPGEAHVLAEAMTDLVRLVDGRASPARVVAGYTWPEFIARNRLPPGTELRLAAERRSNAGLVYSVELALPGTKPLPAQLTPRDWSELAQLFSRASRR